MLKKPHPAGSENTAISQFEIIITKIPQEKLSNTTIPQTPLSPSCNMSLHHDPSCLATFTIYYMYKQGPKRLDAKHKLSQLE